MTLRGDGNSNTKAADGHPAEDIRRKRARGEIACAECRRLKVKCDRKLPCGGCSRRGCAPICPNGSLTTGQGTRFVLSDTAQLHQKINEMSERIRALEDALELAYSHQSPGKTHYLLQKELLSIKNPFRTSSDNTDDHNKAEGRSPDAPGAISLGPNGSVQYFTGSAGTETLFMKTNLGTLEEGVSDVSRRIRDMSEMFPLWRDLGVSLDAAIATLKNYLPPYSRALALIDCYFDNCSFYFRPINRRDMLDSLFNPVYRDLSENQNDLPSMTPYFPIHPHQLALIFIVFAVGASVDLNQPQANPEGDQYFHLARGALSMRPMLEETTFETVLCLAYMSVYRNMAEKGRTMTSNHTYLSVACLLARNLGLHRDPARWGLSSRLVEMRRRAFWEINSLDHFQGLVTGCSPFFPLERVDCAAPQDDPPLTNEDTTETVYWSVKHKGLQASMSNVIAKMTGSTIPPHATVMDYDGQIREFFAGLEGKMYTLEEQPDEVGNWPVRRNRFLLAYCQASTLIFIHRTFFAQCCQKHPTSPTASPSMPSYLAAYKNSIFILQSMKKEAEHHLPLLSRFSHLWTHAFTAAIIVGLAVARGPNNQFASHGLIELAHAVSLFENGAQSSRRARMALPYLMTLLRKAHRAYTEYNNKGLVVPTFPEEGDDEDVDLELFSGGTRVFAAGSSSQKSSSSPSPPGPAAVWEAVQSVSAMNIPQVYNTAELASAISPTANPWPAWATNPTIPTTGNSPQPPSFAPSYSNNVPEGGAGFSNDMNAAPPLTNQYLPPSTSDLRTFDSTMDHDSPEQITTYADVLGMSNIMSTGGEAAAAGTAFPTPAGGEVPPHSQREVELFGLDPLAGQTQADNFWAAFVRDTNLFWDPSGTQGT